MSDKTKKMMKTHLGWEFVCRLKAFVENRLTLHKFASELFRWIKKTESCDMGNFKFYKSVLEIQRTLTIFEPVHKSQQKQFSTLHLKTTIENKHTLQSLLLWLAKADFDCRIWHYVVLQHYHIRICHKTFLEKPAGQAQNLVFLVKDCYRQHHLLQEKLFLLVHNFMKLT